MLYISGTKVCNTHGIDVIIENYRTLDKLRLVPSETVVFDNIVEIQFR